MVYTTENVVSLPLTVSLSYMYRSWCCSK